METEAQSFLETMISKRGYVQEFHRTLAEHDLEFLKAYEALLDASYLKDRRLSRLTKEMIYISVLSAIGAAPEHLKSHMVAAAQEGATSHDILEVLELTLPTAGVARFVQAIHVWHDAFD